MRVMAKGHKDNKILYIISTSVFFIATIVFGIACILTKGDGKVPAIVLYIICFLSFIWLLVISITQLLTKTEVIIYDIENKILIIKRYKKIINIKIDEISEIKYKNRGLTSIGVLIFMTEYSYGRIVFVLKNGEKVKTPIIDEVIESYNNICLLLDK